MRPPLVLARALVVAVVVVSACREDPAEALPVQPMPTVTSAEPDESVLGYVGILNGQGLASRVLFTFQQLAYFSGVAIPAGDLPGAVGKEMGLSAGAAAQLDMGAPAWLVVAKADQSLGSYVVLHLRDVAMFRTAVSETMTMVEQREGMTRYERSRPTATSPKDPRALWLAVWGEHVVIADSRAAVEATRSFAASRAAAVPEQTLEARLMVDRWVNDTRGLPELFDLLLASTALRHYSKAAQGEKVEETSELQRQRRPASGAPEVDQVSAGLMIATLRPYVQALAEAKEAGLVVDWSRQDLVVRVGLTARDPTADDSLARRQRVGAPLAGDDLPAGAPIWLSTLGNGRRDELAKNPLVLASLPMLLAILGMDDAPAQHVANSLIPQLDVFDGALSVIADTEAVVLVAGVHEQARFDKMQRQILTMLPKKLSPGTLPGIGPAFLRQGKPLPSPGQMQTAKPGDVGLAVATSPGRFLLLLTQDPVRWARQNLVGKKGSLGSERALVSDPEKLRNSTVAVNLRPIAKVVGLELPENAGSGEAGGRPVVAAVETDTARTRLELSVRVPMDEVDAILRQVGLKARQAANTAAGAPPGTLPFGGLDPRGTPTPQ